VHVVCERTLVVGVTGRTTGVRSSVDAKYSSFLHSVQVGSGAYPASYPIDTVGYFHGDKTVGSRRRPFSIQYRGQEWWSYTSVPPYVFIVWCLIKHRDNLPCLKRTSAKNCVSGITIMHQFLHHHRNVLTHSSKIAQTQNLV
jgi:hypothetical protein